MTILVLGSGLSWFPISGNVPVLTPLLADEFRLALINPPKAISYPVVPAVTIVLFSVSRTARLVRSAMLEVLNQDLARTARAQGAPELRVVLHHPLRNAWPPVVTMLGLEFGFLLSGVFVVETIFSWPDVGRLVFNAINQRDIPFV